MKKTITFLLALLFCTGVFAQTITEIKTTQLPKTITGYFKKNLPTATLVRAGKSFTKGVMKYEVVALLNGSKSIYEFDKDGKFLSRGKSRAEVEKAKQSYSITTDKPTDPKPLPVKK